MKNDLFSKIPRRAAVGLLVLSALAVCVAQATATPPVGTLLFQDTFDTSTVSNDMNFEYATRQSGPLAGISYFQDNVGTTSNIQLDGSTMGLAQWATKAALDRNFNNAISQGGLMLSFDYYAPAGIYWGAAIIGTSGTSQFINNTDPHFGTLFRGDYNNGNDCVTFDGSTLVGDVPVTSAPLYGAWHHFDFVFSDSTDPDYNGTTNLGNPFDGSGSTQMDIYVDGASTPFYTYGKEAGFANNFMGFQVITLDGTSYAKFDNLQIYGSGASAMLQWVGGSNDWSNAASWSGSPIPGTAAGDVARFQVWNTDSPTTVNVDADKIVGTLVFDSPKSYKLVGNTITLDGGTNLAQILVASGSHEIASPLAQVADLSLDVANNATLTLSGPVTSSSGTGSWNVNYNSTGGTVAITGSAAPGGTVSIDKGVVKVLAGGTLTTSMLYGDGQLWLDSGVLAYPGGGAKPSITLNTLGLGVETGTSGAYSLDAGETLALNNLIGGAGTSEFHFNGGTLQVRSGGGRMSDLTALYLDQDSTIDTNGAILQNYSPIQGSSKLTLAGSGGMFVYVDSPDFHGAVDITGGVVWIDGDHPQGLGDGAINVAAGSNLWFTGGTTNVTFANAITLNGPGNFPTDPEGSALAWRHPGTGTLTGTLTLHNSGTGAKPDVNSYAGCTIELRGKITGDGGLQIGNALAWGYNRYGSSSYTISGNVSNDYQGNTDIQTGIVTLAKTDDLQGKSIAIPSAQITLGSPLAQGAANDTYDHAGIVFAGNNQINPNAVVTMYGDSAAGWALLQLNGTSQAIGGLSTATTGVENYIRNNVSATAPDPNATGKLTVNGGGIYAGYIYDDNAPEYGGGTGVLSLEKAGTGTLTLLLDLQDVANTATKLYSGETTISGGTLQIVQYNPEKPLALTGAVSGAGNLTVGEGTAATSLTLGNVNLGGTVLVCDNSTLTATSITADTLTIGGTAPYAPAAAVPEPSMLALLALAGAAFGWIRLRRR